MFPAVDEMMVNIMATIASCTTSTAKRSSLGIYCGLFVEQADTVSILAVLWGEPNE
jgi:hypothetical protein